MIYAEAESGHRILAAPGRLAVCPSCRQPLVAKCGEIKVWHWAHQSCDCDEWWEPESAWHLSWKSLVCAPACEVPMGRHRADIVGNRNTVIELQHSSIGLQEAQEREQFYGHMIWLFDAQNYIDNVCFRQREGYKSFRWKWPRMFQARLERPIFWDLGDGHVFQVKKIHQQTPCGGWGRRITRTAFIEYYLSDVLNLPQSRAVSAKMQFALTS